MKGEREGGKEEGTGTITCIENNNNNNNNNKKGGENSSMHPLFPFIL